MVLSASRFKVVDDLPDRQMTVDELVRFGGSRYVLSAHPRVGSRFAPDTAQFRFDQRVVVLAGRLRWNGLRTWRPQDLSATSCSAYTGLSSGTTACWAPAAYTATCACSGWTNISRWTPECSTRWWASRALCGCSSRNKHGLTPTKT